MGGLCLTDSMKETEKDEPAAEVKVKGGLGRPQLINNKKV